MQRSLTMRAAAAVFLGVLWGAGSLRAEIGESHMHFPTDGAGTHLFQLNPAINNSKNGQGGVALLQRNKEVKLDQEADDGEVINNQVKEDYLSLGTTMDLGAGAALGLSHQVLYRKVETVLDSQDQDPLEELAKIQHSAIRMIVNLTSQLKMGLVVRYLFKDIRILGSPRFSQSEMTIYKTGLLGYGAGAQYQFDKAAIGYTYYPPLRGKTEVFGEEFIVVEPGMLMLDGYFSPAPAWRLGVSGRRWIHEFDDLANGTTAEDDQTVISLYGLDVDQYLLPQQLIMAGFEYDLSKKAAFKLAIGRETAEFNFSDLVRYNSVGINPRSQNDPQVLQYNKIRAMFRFEHNHVEFRAGGTYWTRSHDFPESMDSAKYVSSGQEVFGMASMDL